MDISSVCIYDELNLYLVSEGLKPASLICLEKGYSFNLHLKTGFFIIEASFDSLKEGTALVSRVIDDPDMTKFLYLKNFIPNLAYCIPIAVDKRNYARLRTAKTDQEIGIALGFPEEAVKAFSKLIDGEIRDGQYMTVREGEVVREGMQIPSWLAYISYVPEQLDLLRGNVSPSTLKLYQRNLIIGFLQPKFI